MRNQWVDIDLDYFNESESPMSQFESMMLSIDPSTKAFFCVNHQEVLPIVNEAVEKKWIKKPFTIFRVDDHHDYYGRPDQKSIHCGNFGYHVPLDFYKEFVWVTRSPTTYHDDWGRAKNWIKQQGKKARVVTGNFVGNHYYSIWKYKKNIIKDNAPYWDPRDVGLVTITVSPDYQELKHNLGAMVEYCADYFKIKERPVREGKFYRPSGWKLRSRPLTCNLRSRPLSSYNFRK